MIDNDDIDPDKSMKKILVTTYNDKTYNSNTCNTCIDMNNNDDIDNDQNNDIHKVKDNDSGDNNNGNKKASGYSIIDEND